MSIDRAVLGAVLGNQLVWFCAVIGAGQGQAWPGVVAAAVYLVWQWRLAVDRIALGRLMAVALVLGMVIDSGLATLGWVQYAAPWTGSHFAPAWILALWLAFVPLLAGALVFLQRSAWLAFAFGAVGGPLAYLGAARGFDAVVFVEPRPAALWLAVGWGVAMTSLSMLARQWNRSAGQSLRPTGDVPA